MKKMRTVMADYMDTQQVARRFNVSQDTVRQMIADGRLRAINIGPIGGRPTYRVLKQSVRELELRLMEETAVGL